MHKRPQIIGLAGTNGAGKDTVGRLLAEQYGYLFVSVTDLLREECHRRGLPVERQYLRSISAEWRRQHGLGVLVDRAVSQYKQTAEEYTGVVMASLRNPYEADRIHELGGTMVWVDADPRIRYERVRRGERGREGEDNKTFEAFIADEAAEMHQSGDEATLNMAAVKDRADIPLFNNSEDIQILTRDLARTLHL